MVEIAKCRMCGSRAFRVIDSWECGNVECQASGPNNDYDGAKWNILMSTPAPASKLSKGFNQAALAEMIEKGFRSRGSYGPNPFKDMAEHAAQIVLSRIAVSATLASSPAAPEPAAGTVRVRIPVKVYANGYMHISWSRFEDGSQVASGSTEAIGAIITADIPLPQPVEIPGTVESGS